MPTIFLSGSRNIKNLDRKFTDRINNIIDSSFEIVIGDADGADTSIQSYLLERRARSLTVYCAGLVPRNNLGNWQIRPVLSSHAKGTRAFFTAKDIEMAKIADYGLMIWDAMSTGTLSNILQLLARGKTSIVFLNKNKTFKTVGKVGELEELLAFMSEHARLKANEKIRIIEKISALKNEQASFFA
jgi:hypothetical protein